MADIERIERELRDWLLLSQPMDPWPHCNPENIHALLSELSRLREREAKAVEVVRDIELDITLADEISRGYDLEPTLATIRAFIAEHGEGKP